MSPPDTKASNSLFGSSAFGKAFHETVLKTAKEMPPNTGSHFGFGKFQYKDVQEAKDSLTFHLHGASEAVEKGITVGNQGYDMAIKFARGAADYIVTSYPDAGTIEELIEKGMKDIADSQTIKITRRSFRDVQWSMLVPFLLALLVLGMTMYRVSTNLLFTGTNTSHIATLIPIFMIFGESILAKALAVCIATPRNDSPHFGCGWFSWSLSALLPALSGTRDLLPKPEIDCKVLNMKSGQCRKNTSFVLSRVMRDLETNYAPKTGGLTIEILDAVAPTVSLSRTDVLVENIWTFFIMFSQLLIAIYAFLQYRDESVILFLGTAIFLMEAVVNMPIWSTTKFSARKEASKTYALMRDNGQRHVFIIRNMHENAWNIEDLAGGASSTYDYTTTLEAHVLIWTFLSFLALTILSTTLSDQSALYILAILTMGTVGNIMHAAVPRKPWMHGIALSSVETISNDNKVFGALLELQKKYNGLGEPLIAELFPGGLTKEQEEIWTAMNQWNMKPAGREEKFGFGGDKMIGKVGDGKSMFGVLLGNEIKVESSEDDFCEL